MTEHAYMNSEIMAALIYYLKLLLYNATWSENE